MKESSDNFKKEIKNIKSTNQKWKKIIVIEMKNTLQGIFSRLDDKERISNLEDRGIEISQ